VGINKQATKLFTVEDESEFIIRSLPSLKVQMTIDISEYTITTIVDEYETGKCILLGDTKSTYVGGILPEGIIVDYRKKTYDDVGIGWDNNKFKHVSNTGIQKEVVALSYPEVIVESEMWQSLGLDSSNRAVSNRASSAITPLTKDQVQEFVKTLDFSHTQFTADEEFSRKSLNSALNGALHRYNGFLYLFADLLDGAQTSRTAIIKIRNKNVVSRILDVQRLGVSGDLIIDRNFAYIPGLNYKEFPPFHVIDLGKFRLLEPDVVPLGAGPLKDGLAFNLSQSLIAIKTNMSDVEEDEAEEDTTDSEVDEQNTSLEGEGENGIWVYSINRKTGYMDREWRVPVSSNGKIVSIKFVGDKVLIVGTSANGIIAFDCGQHRTLWIEKTPFGNKESKLVGLEVNPSNGNLAAYSKNEIRIFLANTGLPLSDVFSPLQPDVNNKGPRITDVSLQDEGNLEFTFGNRHFRRKSPLPKSILFSSLGRLEVYTAISHLDGLTHLTKLPY
jgi:hypothetical protein